MSTDQPNPTTVSPYAATTSAEPDDPQRPEALVVAAFAGGLVAALILKRLGHD